MGSSSLAGAKLEIIMDHSTCENLLAWVNGSGSGVLSFDRGFLWSLAHCVDGVTWGYWDSEISAWKTAAAVFPDIAPVIGLGNLLELRIFGKFEEVLIWKSNGLLRGRRLMDAAVKEEYLSPLDETRILLGNRLLAPPRAHFSRVAAPTGAEQVVPLNLSEADFKDGRWPLRLEVRHYKQQDPETGDVRLAATRLVEIRREA